MPPNQEEGVASWKAPLSHLKCCVVPPNARCCVASITHRLAVRTHHPNRGPRSPEAHQPSLRRPSGLALEQGAHALHGVHRREALLPRRLRTGGALTDHPCFMDVVHLSAIAPVPESSTDSKWSASNLEAGFASAKRRPWRGATGSPRLPTLAMLALATPSAISTNGANWRFAHSALVDHRVAAQGSGRVAPPIGRPPVAAAVPGERPRAARAEGRPRSDAPHPRRGHPAPSEGGVVDVGEWLARTAWRHIAVGRVVWHPQPSILLRVDPRAGRRSRCRSGRLGLWRKRGWRTNRGRRGWRQLRGCRRGRRDAGRRVVGLRSGERR